MFNHAKFSHTKFNSKTEIAAVPQTFVSTYGMGGTRKTVWLNKIVE